MSGWAAVAAASAAGAVGWLLGPATGGLGRLGAVAVVARERPGGRPAVGWLGALVGCVAVGWTLGWVVAVVVGLGLGTGWRLTQARRASSRRAAARAEVRAAGEALAGLLQIGAVPSAALAAAASESTVLAEAAAAQTVGGDVAAALRRSASGPGYDGLVDLAQAWQVATRTGASLAVTIEATAERLAGQDEVARVVAAELAGPRATARIMAVLPAGGLVLGAVWGGDPVGFLLGHPLGQACLIGAVALVCAGLVWSSRIAERAGG